jgi:hypothetical protein
MTSKLAVIDRVRIEEGKAGLSYATSPDLRGLRVGRSSLDALLAAVPEAISALVEADSGERVNVFPAVRWNDPTENPFVAVPVDLVQRAAMAGRIPA